ncbi:acrosomal protein KIAA1210 homolog [Mus pahari]|uniref:acrosomal protein KIAA1210 homolog n=1 Tax=Mus pahari TaxID=10093 RepID=UPI001114B347|nr:acrosomal protein KIAA1210 homolog [Mus pahari]
MQMSFSQSLKLTRKKKSKFKAFKSFFGKKKKKEPEEVPEAAVLKPRFSSSSGKSGSSLQPVLEKQTMESKPKSGMGAKSISHDSIFCLGPEPEKTAVELHTSPEPHRSRSLKIKSLRSRRLSISPLVIRSEKVCEDLEKFFASDRTTTIFRRRSSQSSTPRKSFSELSSDPELSQSSESSTQQPSGFSTPATSQGCLDSSAAKYKIALSPRKQKKRKSTSTPVKVKQEEQLESVPAKEKTTTETNQAEQEEQRVESTGLSSQDQSYKTESEDTTVDKTPSTDSVLRLNPRRRRRRAKNEWEILERGLLKSTHGYSLSTKAESSPTEEIAGKEHSFLKLFLEKKDTEQSTTTEADITSVQEMPSDKGDAERELTDIDVEAEEAPAPQPTPTDVAESMSSGPSPRSEHRPSGGKKKKDKAGVLPWIKKSTSQKEATVLRREEVQVHVHPSQVCGEGEEASSPDLQRFQSQLKLSLESTTYHKEKHPRSGLRALSTSVSSATAEDDVSPQKNLPLPLRRWPNAGEISSDSKSTSEYEKNVDVELSKTEQQQPLRYSSKLLGKPKAREASAKLESSSDERSCEEMTSAHSSQSLEEFEECSESRGFIRGSISEERQATRRHSQALQEMEEKEVSTESSNYIEKYNSSQDLSSSEQEQQASPVSKSSLKQWSAPAKPEHPIHTAQQQPPIMVNISGGPKESEEPLTPTHNVKSWLRSQSEYPVFAEPEGVAADWDIFMQPSPRPRLEQEVSAGPELTVFEKSVAAQPSEYSPQPSVRPSIKKETSLGAESTPLESPPPQHHFQPLLKPFIQQQVSAFERGVSMDPRLPTQFQSWMKPQGKQSFSSTPESTAFEGSTSMDHMTLTLSQPMLQPYQEVPLESETVAAKMTSMGQMHSKYSAHPLPSHQSQPVPESTSAEGAILMELLPPQPSVTPRFQPLMTQDPVSTPTQWSSPMEPTSAKHIFQTQASPKFKRVPVGSDSPEAQGSMSMQPVPPSCPPQSWVIPTFEQISVSQGSVPAAWAIPIYPPAPRMPSKPLMGSAIALESKPRYSLQPWQSTPFEQVSVSSDRDPAAAAASWSHIDPPASRILSQPLMRLAVKQPTSMELASVSVPQSSSLEQLPSRFPFQPRADPEHYGAEEGVATLRRPRRQRSQPPVSSEFKEDVSSGSPRASGEWSISVEKMPPKYALQPWLGPEFEQQAKEGDVLREAWLSGHPCQTISKHKVEKTPSSFESTSLEGGIRWRPLPPKRPSPFLIRSKVQEMSSRLESAIAQDSSKKPQSGRPPSKSFVKFMAQQVFSESAPSDVVLHPKPVARGRRRPSRSLLKPKLDEYASLYNWDDEPKKDTTLQNLRTKQRFQLSRKPEEPQEVLPFSEGAGDISQPLGKLEYKQKVSFAVSLPDEWERSAGQLPSTQPSQAFDVAELQSPVLSVDSANVPVEWRISECHQPSGQLPQSFLTTDYQQQVSVNSASAAAEGAIPEKSKSCWPMLKGPASTTNLKYGQGYRDIPTSVIKPATYTSAPAQKPFVSMGTYFKDEVSKCCDETGSSSLLSTSKAEVENVFGVRLRRTSQYLGMQNPDPCKPFVSDSAAARKEQENKGALQVSGGGPEQSRPAFSFEEKQGNRPRYEGTLKKSAVFRPPGKTSICKANSPVEPTWITTLKQRQRGFISHFLKKPRTRSEISAVTKDSRYEVKYNLELETVPKESEPITDIPPKKTFVSSFPRYEMPHSRHFSKSVAFYDQKMISPHTKEKITRRSSSLPPKFPQCEEPEWFSMAKKKAQAWSQIADIMQ